MAENSDVDELVPGLKTKISEISAFLSTSIDDCEDRENVSIQMTPLLLEKHKYEMELIQLEREISGLEEKLKLTEQQMASNVSSQQINNVLLKLRNSSPSHIKNNTTNNLLDEVNTLQAEIETLVTLTGIQLKEVKSRVIKQDINKKEKVHTVNGSSHGWDFQVQFTVTEKLAENNWSSSVSDLKIAVEENIVDEIGSLLEKLEMDSSLQPFFQAYETCTKWIAHRKRCFSHFKGTYPSVISLPHGVEGECMLIESKDNQGVIFMLCWSLNIDGYTVSPNIRLLVKAPSEMIKSDKKDILKESPAKFQKMVTAFGIEKAINTMIRLLDS